MFEINNQNNVKNNNVVQENPQNIGQRAFLDSIPDCVQILGKQKKNISFKGAINGIYNTFTGNKSSEQPISKKAIEVLKQNNLIDESFEPATSILSKEEKLSDIREFFQKKLAIDFMPDSRKEDENLFYEDGSVKAQIRYTSFGKPTQITYFKDSQPSYMELFDYAEKRGGYHVISNQAVYKYKNGKPVLENEIHFHKHHNGAVTISTTDGKTMSYSLTHNTIRDYNNGTQVQNNTDKPTPQVQPTAQQPAQNISEPIKDEKELFVRPNPTYPNSEYSSNQLYKINKTFNELNKTFDNERLYHEPDGKIKLSYCGVKEEIQNLQELVLNVKDPKIQERLTEHISEIRSDRVPTESVGYYDHLNMREDYYGKYNKINDLIKLSFLTDKDALKINEHNYIMIKNQDKIPGGTYNSKFIDAEDMESIKNELDAVDANGIISEEEKLARKEEIKYKTHMRLIGTAISMLEFSEPDIVQYLNDTYLKSNLPKEHKENLKKIEKALGKPIILSMYSGDNSCIGYEELENFSKMPQLAKEHFLKNPTLIHGKYLHEKNHFGIEKPYVTLSNLSEEEWKIFEGRNMAEVIDVIVGYNQSDFASKTGKNIHTAIAMDDNTWNKINDYRLFEIEKPNDGIKLRKYQDLKFRFEDMQDIVENLSPTEWETAKKRGIVDMTSNNVKWYNNYGNNIGTNILIAMAKAPESTFNYLKNELNVFIQDEPMKFDIVARGSEAPDNIAKGINFLSKSHNDVYQNLLKLKDNGFNSSVTLNILGICADNYGKFGKYLTEKAIELKNNGIRDYDVAQVLPMYVDLQITKNKSNINELSIDEKRALLKTLVKYNAILFDHNMKGLLESNIVPKNKEEYCTLLPKLVKSIGIDTRPVSQETINNFENSMSEMSKPNSEFLNTTFDKSTKIDMDYSREDFIKDVQKKTQNLTDTEKMKVYDYFGFDLTIGRDNILQMHGYPINVNNGAKLAEINAEMTKKAIEEVRPIVEKFSNNNKVSIDGKPELTKQLNDIVELFPEIRTMIGKKQHHTHDYTVDIHTLKVLQGVMSDKHYQTLPEHDKKMLNIATILHDLTKAEGVVDKTHPSYSAYDSYHLLEKMNMPEKDKINIYQIIKNHDWLEQYNKKIKVGPHEYREQTPKEKDKVAKDIAFELKDGNNFLMANILTKADMQGVKETDDFFNKYESAYINAGNHIEPLIDNIKKTAIHLPQTKIPKASELIVDGKNVEERIIKAKNGDNIKVKIVNLKKDMDLGELGFEKGLNSNDLNVIVHALDEGSQAATFQALGSVDSDSLLSSSYVNYQKGNYHVFRQQGFILDVASSDIQAGTYKDFGSGYGKDLETLKTEYLFGGNRKQIREFMSSNLKKKMNISDEQYKKLYPEIADKSITELDKSHPKIATAMREMFNEMEIHKRRYGRDYNEWLVSRPKIQAVFVQSSKYHYENPPEFLVRYAAENDIPIINFGE